MDGLKILRNRLRVRRIVILSSSLSLSLPSKVCSFVNVVVANSKKIRNNKERNLKPHTHTFCNVESVFIYVGSTVLVGVSLHTSVAYFCNNSNKAKREKVCVVSFHFIISSNLYLLCLLKQIKL